MTVAAWDLPESQCKLEQTVATFSFTQNLFLKSVFFISFLALTAPSTTRRAPAKSSASLGACFNLVGVVAGTSCLPDSFVCLTDLTLPSLIFTAAQFSAQNGGLQRALISKEASLPWLPLTKPRPCELCQDLPPPRFAPVLPNAGLSALRQHSKKMDLNTWIDRECPGMRPCRNHKISEKKEQQKTAPLLV